jgi:Flp pilus assembly protein TadD
VACGTASNLWAAAEDSDAIVSHGVELRREGRDREALEEFERAAKISRTPRVVAQIGTAEVAMGMWPGAEDHLREALGQGGDPWIRKNRVLLERTLATVGTHLGSIEIWGTPSGAEVVVNGTLGAARR